MDFTPTEEQAAAADLAARIFGDHSTHERLTAAGTGSDAGLWKELCAAGLVGAVADTGLLGLVLLLEEQGRTTAQVPFAASCVYGLLAVTAHGSPEQRERLLPGIADGTVVVAGAISGAGTLSASPPAPSSLSTSGKLTGVLPAVPWLRDATHVLVADDLRRLWLVRTAEAAVSEPVELTAPWSAGRLTLEHVAAVAGTPAHHGDDWALVRAIEQGDTAGALRELQAALEVGGVPFQILGQIGYAVRTPPPRGRFPARRVPTAVDAPPGAEQR